MGGFTIWVVSSLFLKDVICNTYFDIPEETSFYCVPFLMFFVPGGRELKKIQKAKGTDLRNWSDMHSKYVIYIPKYELTTNYFTEFSPIHCFPNLLLKPLFFLVIQPNPELILCENTKWPSEKIERLFQEVIFVFWHLFIYSNHVCVR